MSNRLVVLSALCLVIGSRADAKPHGPPHGQQQAAVPSPALYEQHLPIQIVFIGTKPGTACPANPTFDPWLDFYVTSPCTTAPDSFSPLDVDEDIIRRMLPG